MRKMILAMMAVAAIAFTSCNNKTAKTDVAIDSTSFVEEASSAELAGIDAENLTKELGEKMAANNPEAVQTVIQQAKDKIAEYVAQGDAEAAKIYQTKINAFLTENAEKIRTFLLPLLIGLHILSSSSSRSVCSFRSCSGVMSAIMSVNDSSVSASCCSSLLHVL